jgi:hypothetical protein
MAVAVALMAFLLPVAVYGQETRGKITGRVTDTSKAVVPGAAVSAIDAARGTTATAVSNEQGLFQIPYLLPGRYRLEVELTGFKKYVQDNVILQMNGTVDLPIVLELGNLQETVSVVAETPVVNTSDASMGLVVDQARLASLPLIHGDPYKIMGLAPG